MDRDFTFGGRSFKLCKIDAFKQFHVARRLGPILADLLPLMKDVQKLQKLQAAKAANAAPSDEEFDELAKLASPLVAGFSRLTDADADYVLLSLLSAIEMQQATGNWIRVANGTLVMVQDFDLRTLLQLAGRAFMFNLAGFFDALPHQ